MDMRLLVNDYILLDIRPGASAEEAAKAYHRMKALYSEGSMATYSLFPEQERALMLDRIERAYMRIIRDIEGRRIMEQDTPVEYMNTGAPVRPDPADSVGACLRKRREEMGMTIKDVAARTRIRSTYIENIEHETFEKLPAPVYLRGFVLQYARILQIPDPEYLAAEYIRNQKENMRKP